MADKEMTNAEREVLANAVVEFRRAAIELVRVAEPLTDIRDPEIGYRRTAGDGLSLALISLLKTFRPWLAQVDNPERNLLMKELSETLTGMIARL